MDKLSSTKYTIMHLHAFSFTMVFFFFFVERESKIRRNYLFVCKNNQLLFPIVRTDFCIQSAKF